ncbi:MAG: exodeoxyribonuclease VII small subunit [Gammaproteobacteria bacterium]|nr:exodeoxyribonuclease VII small subunit [Gammaproteobacteria bacterium]
MPRKSKEFDFEKSLVELEELVELMEEGDLSLEDSLKHFERGIALTRACHQALSDAEQKVKILMKDQDGNEKLVDFEPEEDQG